MYISHQLLSTHQDEILRRAADRRLAQRVSRASRAASGRPRRSSLTLRGLRLGRLVSQG